MIAFDFEYYKPETIREAVEIFKQAAEQKKSALYYAGGTEIISQARRGILNFDVVIDVKAIPELNIFELQGEQLVIGAAVSLTQIVDSGLFPLLCTTIRRAADHTARNRITIGGNICGKIPYREAILPLLLTDSEVSIANLSGEKMVALTKAFNKEMILGRGELLTQIAISKDYLELPFVSIKKTRQGKNGYPLVTIAAIKVNDRIRIAFSGLSYPFRLQIIEEALNSDILIEERVIKILKHLPEPLSNDLLGSAEFREFLVKNLILEIAERFQAAKCC